MLQFKLEGEYQALAKVQDEEQDALLAKGNVVGVALGHKIKGGIDTGDPCVSVLVNQKMLDDSLLLPEDKIAPTVGKYKTDVIETGDIFAGAPTTTTVTEKRTVRRAPTVPERFVAPPPVNGVVATPEETLLETAAFEQVGIEALARRRRPAEGGYSVAHYRVTAGTIATAVYDARAFPGIPQKYYILSNNHVLANSNMARIGDPILQPGPADGGVLPSDHIANLSRWVPIRFGTPGTSPALWPNNYVDAAIAEGQFHDIDREIYWIGYLRGVDFLRTTGTFVQKTGRTTSYTTGRVTNINATVVVNYGGGRQAKMVRQIITTNMSAPGDSGAQLCDMSGNAVGLLFAGSSSVTIHNHIIFVQSLLGIRVV